MIVRHAHGYFVQTLSDLGWVGVGLTLLAGLAWVLTAARTLGMRRSDRGLPFDAERVGAVDDGGRRRGVRRALRDRLDLVRARQRRARAAARGLGGRPRAAAGAARAAARAAWRSRWSRAEPRAPAGAASPPRRWRACSPRWRSPPRSSRRWAAYQPVSAENLGDTALEQADRGDYEQAVATAQKAVDRNPLSDRPAVRAGRDPAGPRADARGQGRADQGDRGDARQRRGVAPARPVPARRARGAAHRAEGLPGRLLPRPQNRRSWTDLIVATRAVQADGG